jgi:RimJ/RimL family protein N-acetyltransferase
MITLRLATSADAETLARLRWDFRTELRLDPTPPPHTREEFQVEMLAFLEEAFTSGSWAIWLAAEDGRIIANLYIRRIRKVPNISLWKLAMSPTFIAFRKGATRE